MDIKMNEVKNIQENFKITEKECLLFFNAVFNFLYSENVIDYDFYSTEPKGKKEYFEIFLEKMKKYNFIKK